MAGLSRTDVDVVVVGRGAVAAAAAWHLAGAGRDVLLLARRPAGSRPSGATVPSRSGEPRASVGSAAAALPLWREVEAETGVVLLSLIGAVDHGATDRTAAVAETLDSHRVPYAWLRPDEAERRWPGMVFRTPVLHQPDGAGRVHAAQAALALSAAAVGRGAGLATTVTVREVTARGEDQVVLTTSGGRLRARRVLVVAGPHASGPVPGDPNTGPWAAEERIVGFSPRGANPCVAREHDWPVFTHHTGSADGWPGPVFGAPAACGDVFVGFEGSGPDRCPPPDRLRDYVERMLPGLQARAVVAAPRRTTEDDGLPPLPAAGGPIVVATDPGGRGTAYAPVLGRALADVTCPRTPAQAARG